MCVLQGWFPQPRSSKSKDEKAVHRYKFMGVFLTEAFIRTYRRVTLEDLVISGETKFVGGLLDMQEVHQVVDLKDEFNPFYVTQSVKEALVVMLQKLPRKVVV